MPKHTQIQHHILFSDLGSCRCGESIEIAGQEAHHAIRVKRVRPSERVGVLDGCGRVAGAIVRRVSGSKSKPILHLELESIQIFPLITPRVELFAALPKGDRLDRMIDQIAQIGVSTFRPLLCERSQRKPETVRADKLERIAIESTKQCHRPWALEIAPPIPFEEAINDPDALVADGTGQADPIWQTARRSVILIGPEGGWSEGERALIGATNTPVVRFGLFVLRIEAAACAASAIVLANAPAPQGEIT